MEKAEGSIPGTPLTVTKASRSELKYALGVAALAFVVIGWVGTNFLTKSILGKYDKPFLVSYLSGVCLQAYFMFFFLGDPLQASAASTATSDDGEKLPPLTTKETIKIAAVAFVFYFTSNFANNMACGLTSTGSASILASTCGFFTLVFGRVAGVEKLTFPKLVAVLISVGGVIILGASEFSDSKNTMKGNALALAGAALYGVYSTYLKKATVDESRVSMLSLFAFVGFFTMLLTWPVLFILDYIKFEPLELPPSSTVVWYMIINLVFGSLLPNYLWNVAFLYTSQMVVAIGLSFTIPLTLAIEYFYEGKSVSIFKIGSAICLLIGFSIVNVVTIWPKYDVNPFKSR